MIKRSILSDGRPPRVPYTADEISQDLKAHQKAVGNLLYDLANRLRHKAQAHDRTLTELFQELHKGVNDVHRDGGRAYRYVPPEHAKAEKHHWDVEQPGAPDLIDFLEYMVDRAVRSYANEGIAPETLVISVEDLQEMVIRTEQKIDEMAEAMQDA